MSLDIEDLLTDGMERFAEQIPAPSGLARRAARARRQRRLRSRAVAAAGTAALAAAAVLAATGGQAPGTAGHALTTAFVIKNVDQALADSHKIAVISFRAGPLTPLPDPVHPGIRGAWVVTWFYRGATNNWVFRPDGMPYTEQQFLTVGGVQRVITVDYLKKTWIQHTQTAMEPAGKQNGCDLNSLGGPWYVPPGDSPDWPSFIRSTLRCGRFALAGHARVDGVSVIRLISTGRDPVSLTLFVSSSTYLPIEVNGLIPGASLRWRWLAPSPANLAKLSAVIPHGFRQLPDPFRGEETPQVEF